MIRNSLISPTIGAKNVKQPVAEEYIQSIKEKIQQRRLQMLLHSYIYYEKGTSIVSDATFDRWAYELRDLQKQYPEIANQVMWYQYFKEWDGTTGFNLPYMVIKDRADWLLEVYHNANK